MRASLVATTPVRVGGFVAAAVTLALALTNVAELSQGDVIATILARASDPPITAIKFLHAWLPRVVVALLAGAGLALAGTVMQQVLRNPIASPMTLGVAAGAQFGLSLATLLAPALLATLAEPAAIAGAAVALAVVMALSWRRRLEPVTVVLAGLIVSLYLGALNAGLLLFFDQNLKAVLIWGGGSLVQHDWSVVTFLAPRIALGLAGLLLLVRPLTVMTLDDATAHGLGVKQQHARVLALVVAVYLAASIVSAVGIVGFIGLAAPALARLAGARTLRQRLLAAPLLGAVLLLMTDQFVQHINGAMAALIPTGAVTALIGAPLLLWLLRELRAGRATNATADVMAPVVRADRYRLLLCGMATLTALLIAVFVVRDTTGWHLASPVQSWLHAPWRPPRIAAAACAGVLLALAGTILQRLLRNPMASPEVLGISGGALAAVVATVAFLPTAGQATLIGAGTLGGLATIAGILFFAQRSGYAPERVLLAGIAIKAVFDAVLGLVAASGSPLWTRLLAWISGSTYGADWSTVGLALAATGLLLPAALMLHRWLELLGLGSDQASARGLQVRHARLMLLGLAALATALATLIVGPLSFVGLMAPHLARMLGFVRARAQLGAAAMLGLTVMVLADWIGRTILIPYEWPAGIAASLLGGLYFMWLLRRL